MDSGKNRAVSSGYAPHNDDGFTCPKCGWDCFKMYPQAIATGAEVWGYEHTCERCGHITTLYMRKC